MDICTPPAASAEVCPGASLLWGLGCCDPLFLTADEAVDDLCLCLEYFKTVREGVDLGPDQVCSVAIVPVLWHACASSAAANRGLAYFSPSGSDPTLRACSSSTPPPPHIM